MAVTITQQTKNQTVVTFWVKEGENSPYQGVLYYDPLLYQALPKGQVAADQLAQFTAWKDTLTALQNAPAPTPDDLALTVVGLQQQADMLTKQVTDLKADPAVAAALAKLSPAVK